MIRTLQSVGPYAVALAIVAYVGRGLSSAQFLATMGKANLWLFIPASVGSLLIWFVGETYLFARLYSYFNARISFREMLEANAAQYFLQIINLIVAGSALVLFMNRRKRVPWLAAGWTMIFQSLIDLELIGALWLAGTMLNPTGLAAHYVPYAGVGLILALAVSCFWLRGRPQWAPARWLYERPSLVAFRRAQPAHYGKLATIRMAIFLGQGLMLYFQLKAFGLLVPLRVILSLLGPLMLVDGLPITPTGMGPLQAALVAGLSAYGQRSDLLTMGLAISAANIILRIPLGLGSAGTFAREVMAPRPNVQLSEGVPATDR